MARELCVQAVCVRCLGRLASVGLSSSAVRVRRRAEVVGAGRAGGVTVRGEVACELRDSRAGRYALSSGSRMDVSRQWRVVAGAL